MYDIFLKFKLVYRLLTNPKSELITINITHSKQIAQVGMLGKKFNIKQIQMPQQMRECVLDEVRKVIENNINTIAQTHELKEVLQTLYGGEWQVIISEGEIATYFSRTYLENFIQLKTQTKTMLIFRRTKEPRELGRERDSRRFGGD